MWWEVQEEGGGERKGRDREHRLLKGRSCPAPATPFVVLYIMCAGEIWKLPWVVISVESPLKGKLGELSVLAGEEIGREGGKVIGGPCSFIPSCLLRSLWAAERCGISQKEQPGAAACLVLVPDLTFLSYLV